MRASNILRVGASLFLSALATAVAGQSLVPPAGPCEIPDFTLKNVDNTLVSLAGFRQAKGLIVVFTCNHCPFAKLYTKRLNALHAHYQPLGVPLVAINSMDTLVYQEETFGQMQQRAKAQHFAFPYLQDATQQVGQRFGADHTPHAYVLWKTNGRYVVRYSGAVDDNGEHPELAQPLLAAAVEQLLHQKPVATPETPSFGCSIFYRRPSALSKAK